MALKKKELIETLIAEMAEFGSNQITKVDAENFLKSYEKIILDEITGESKEFKLLDLGKVKIVSKLARTGKNPFTGEEVVYPAKIVPKFTFSKGVKELVNKDQK